jgi:hypothetical protein
VAGYSNLVVVSIGVLAMVAFLLAVAEFRRYQNQRIRAHLFWALGLVLVTLTLLEEAVFAVGVWNSPLVQSYLFIVALLVGILSLGSAEANLTGRWRNTYFGYVGVMAAAVAFYCAVEPAGPDILSGGILVGNPPLGVVVTSTLLTVPASILMAATSILAAKRFHRWRLASIAAGIIVISIAGALYIVSIPETLYYAEFAGVVLLFFGFGGVRPVTHRAATPAAG